MSNENGTGFPPGLGAPAHRALTAAGVTRLEELSAHPEREVRAWHGIGPSALDRLRAALSEHGLAFAPDDPPA